MRNWLFTFIALTLVSCSSAGSATLPTVRPNPTNTFALPMNAPTPTTASSPSLPSAGWKTFVSANLQVTVDYPPDWSASEQAIVVSFTSTSGDVIQLAKIETGDLSPDEFLNENQLPNTRCSSITNNYGITVRICLDTLSGNYSADFVMASPQGPPQLLSMVMPKHGDLQVFDGMIGSVRPFTSP